MSDGDEIPMPEDPLAWAKKLVDAGSFVLHLQTHTIGKAKRLFDGTGSVYVSPQNGEEVKKPVLELETGDSFVADPSVFLELDEKAADFFMRAGEVVRRVVASCAPLAKAVGVRPATGMLILSVILKSQARELDRARRQNPAASPRG